MLPAWLVRFARKRTWQPLHIKLHRVAQAGMNYWGGSLVGESGERPALDHARRVLKDVAQPVVFDVGANTGQFAGVVLAAFSKGVHIHAFEPSSAAAEIFNRTLTGPIASGQVVLHRFGFSDEPGEAMLHAPASGDPIATLHATTFQLHGRAVVTDRVQLRTVDGFCREENIERIHYLKVDTEGHELAVLKGARGMIESGKVNMVQFEFGECHLDSRVFFRDLYLFLTPRYRIHRILPDGLWPLDEYTPELEIFRTANYLAITR